ncbi:MAG TPA: histidine phosphatase family protein [Acidobacteriaceae bacterium]|jgi:broad specificity phosphatase PhoE
MTSFTPPTRLLMISCPGTRAQREGRFPADEALDEHARKALAGVNWKPHGQPKVWVSPETSALETAQAFSLPADVAPELRECEYGDWSGRSLEDVLNEDAEGLSAWLSDVTAAPHSGESFDNEMTRVAAWLETRPSGIVITHGSIIRAAVVHALIAPSAAFLRIEVAPLTMTDLRFGNGRWTVRSVGVPLPTTGTPDAW